MTSSSKPRVCQCGCGATVNGRYKQGHNQRGKTHCVKGHALTPDNVYQYPGTPRICKTCAGDRAKRYHRTEKYQARKGTQPSRSPRERRIAHVREFYSLSRERFLALEAAHGGVCPICREGISGRDVVVDHDHACCPGPKSCGACVRGLVCHFCNALLHALDNTEWRASAEQYREQYAARRRASAA
jgi:hypothetical protein